MPYDPTLHHRRSCRLPGQNYAGTAAYFITLCVYNRECLFGEIQNDEMHLNEFGNVVLDEWNRTSIIRREMALDAFVAMPNHIHGIVWIENDVFVGPDGRPALHRTEWQRMPRSLGAMIAGFKSITTKRINILRNALGTPLWQPNYYEHIIRDNWDLNRIREYILNNPRKWKWDLNNRRN